MVPPLAVAPSTNAGSTSPRSREQYRARWTGLLLVLGAALLYTLTLDNGLAPSELVGGDLITHQYAQVQARPSNAPGYPLYTMGGWLWFRVGNAAASLVAPTPVNPLPILSSFSMLWALLSLWLLYEVLRFVTSSRYRPESPCSVAGAWPLALLLSAFYAVTYFFWYYATTTEQYTSAVAQTLAMLLVYLRWEAADRAAGEAAYGVRSRPGLLLILLAFLNGLSLAHMLTVALMTPPLVAVVLWQRPSLLRRPGLVAAVIGAACLPLLAYLYVWTRGAAHPEWWGAGTWESAGAWFRAFVSTTQGRDELSWGLEAGRPFFGGGFPALMARELSLPLLLLGTAGMARLRRPTAFLLYGTLLLYALFSWLYRFGNWYQVVLPLYPLLLVGVAALFDYLLHAQDSPAARRWWLRATVYAGIAAAVLWRAAASLPEANSRNRPGDTALQHAAHLVASAPADAALFAAVDDSLALDYLLSIWRLRPDLDLVTSPEAAEALAAGRPLVSTWDAAATLLDEAGSGSAALRLATRNPDWVQFLPAGAAPHAQRALPSGSRQAAPIPLLDGALTLDAWAAQPAPAAAPAGGDQPALDVWLAWRPAEEWPEDLSFSLRPTAGGEYLSAPNKEAGAIVQADRSAPMNGLAAFALDPRRPVDALRLHLAPNATPPDGLTLILYRSTPDGFETLDVVHLPLAPAQAP